MSRRPRTSPVLVTVLALALAACGPTVGSLIGGGSGDSAASVNGTAIDRAPLEADVRAIMESQPDFDEGLLQRQLLTLEVLKVVLDGVLVERGITLTDDDLAEVRATIPTSLGVDEDGLEDALREVGLTVEYLDRVYVPYFAAGYALADQLAEGRVLERREARHILVGTFEEAEEVIAALEAGEDFAALATERSTDPGSAQQGGSLGLQAQGTFVPAFDDFVWRSEVGVLSEPIETEFGFHVIEVLAIESRPAAELTDEERIALVATELQALIDASIDAATVSIVPGLGVWDAAGRRVAEPPVVGEGSTP